MTDRAVTAKGIPTGPHVFRCADTDRQRTAGRLRDAAGKGRLTITELDARLAPADAATHRHELGSLATDLSLTARLVGDPALMRAQPSAESAIRLRRSATGSAPRP